MTIALIVLAIGLLVMGCTTITDSSDTTQPAPTENAEETTQPEAEGSDLEPPALPEG